MPAVAVPPPLPLTGERTVPGVAAENYWFQRHVAAYGFATARCRGGDVIDSGCGEGYGVAMLARRARSVIGVDLAGWVVEHATTAYPGQTFLTADVCALPLPTASADAVVSLQVIEHLPDVARYLREQRRVVRSGGQVIIATPNRLTFSPHHDHGDDPDNLFHIEEFTATELVERIAATPGLTCTEVYGVHHGPRLRALAAATGRSIVDAVLDPVADWPRWLHHVVSTISPDDFELRRDGVDASLDLIVVARAGAQA